MSVTGEPDSPPARYGLSIVDLMTGLAAAFALLAGITRARSTGIGSDVDVSLFDVALHNLNYPGTWYLNARDITRRVARSGHPSLTPSQLYRTADNWLFIMCNKQKFWPILTGLIGKPEWATHPDFATYADRLKHRDRLTLMLDEVLMKETTAHWLALLSGKVPVAPVNDIAQALESGFVEERRAIRDFRYPGGGAARMIANPIRVAGTDLPTVAAPALGADTNALLVQLGYPPEQIEALRKAQTIC
jgi:crotonobetainyl-CoA:carnitine CoA-transferase CaiB-like acyl-CoA transferase